MFTGYVALFNILPIPFVRFQLPSWLIPYLPSGNLEDITNVEDRENLIKKVNLHKVPLQILLEQVLNFTKGYELSTAGKIHPPAVELQANLPDKSRTLLVIDAFRAEAVPLELR